MSQADAEKRVNEVVTQIKADTDAARKATAQLAFWLTASLLIGAFCASLAATEGGGLRDGTWGRKSYVPSVTRPHRPFCFGSPAFRSPWSFSSCCCTERKLLSSVKSPPATEVRADAFRCILP
jgi:hypothetical protein